MPNMNRPSSVWLLDLDDTLHNASAGIFQHIHRNMSAYIARHLGLDLSRATQLRAHYWRRYGATLSGLMRHHGIDPAHFLAETHPLDRLGELVKFDPAVPAMLRQLPGRKIVFSNGPAHYVNGVVETMGIGRHIDGVFAVEHMRFEPKPSVQAFRHLLRAHRLRPERCVLVEDSPDNLRTAKQLGMRTVLVGRGKRPAYADLRITSVLELRRAAGRLLAR